MSGVNKVILIGHLGRDPEIRYTQDGTAVANFSIATSERWTDKRSDEKREKTEWHRIVAWRKLAELCAEYLSKGKQVYIEGKLQTRSWQDDSGVTKYQTEIIANQLQFLGSSGGQSRNNDSYEESFQYETSPQADQSSGDKTKNEGSDDLPF